MHVISPKEFVSIKQSDTLVVLGSGYSINRISKEEWRQIGAFDSVGFNWFCHHEFGPTFFVVREQANSKARSVSTETRKSLVRALSKESYKSTCLVVQDISKHSPNTYNYAKNHKLFNQKGVIVRDVKGKINKKLFLRNIFKHGALHGKCTLTNVMHIALFLKYERIIFAGIDLNDSRYFWLKPTETRVNIKQKRLRYKNRHPVSGPVMRMLRQVKNHFKVNMYTMNPKSAIKKIIPVIDLKVLIYEK